jgi:general nucleoside transport system ATP-binding protein
VSTPVAGATLLSLNGITHTFGSVRALDAASLHVRPGTVHALLGENGAGKSTLMRVAFGMLAPDEGALHWRGAALTLRSPSDALARGIGMVHQHFSLVPAMTVAENVALGGRGRFHPGDAAAQVRALAERTGLALDPDARVSTLPVGAQQRCEIIKALARDARLLILDEPTAVLAPAEARELLAWVRRFADEGRTHDGQANGGHAVVLITHKLQDALSVADDITVLRRGRTVYTGSASNSSTAQLTDAMLGEHGASQYRAEGRTTREGTADVEDAMPAPPDAQTGRIVLRLDQASWRDERGVEQVRAASLVVRAGEIVGLAAVEGSGQHALLRLLAGRLVAQRGVVERPERVGFVPEDRHRDALLLDAPLFENLALRGAGARTGRMHWASWRARTSERLQQFDVRAADGDVMARTLSGGNQQKFVLGRELDGQPEALIVENPSRGLDIRATAAVQEALRTARDGGAAVLVYSSDLDEVLALADRVYVMHAGQVVSVSPERDAVGRAMLGVAEQTERGA